MKIKIRAWHTTKKKMFSAEEMAEDQMCLLPTGEFINVHSNPRLSVIDHEGTMKPLLYTGLKDKNGKEIYAGDRCNAKYQAQGMGINVYGYPVIYYKDRFGLQGKDGDYLCSLAYCDELEVIGNIYENPELLEE